MKIEEIYELYKVNYLVDTDTRNIRNNSLFFALKGDNFNGNKFAADAIAKGVRFAVIDEEEYQNENTILVDNVLEILQKLANYHRRQLNIPIISLTGSNGKTTTKELINAVLTQEYNTTATKGNLNNHIGVPLTLLSMTNKTAIGIVEMGANHQKEIEFLCNIAEPDFGYITNFGKAHLEGFGGIEGVIKGKSELYTFLRKNDKTVFVNPKDDKQVALTNEMNQILLNEDIKLVSSTGYLELSYNNSTIKTQLLGNYNFSNIVTAITIGEHFKITKENIIKGIENYVPNNNRSQIIQGKNNTVILDAYNANPTSIEAALKNFYELPDANKLIILGDMFELGEHSLKEHQNIVDITNNHNVQSLFVGGHFHKTNAQFKFKTFDELTTYIKEADIKEKTLLIKGSRGMSLERLVPFF